MTTNDPNFMNKAETVAIVQNTVVSAVSDLENQIDKKVKIQTDAALTGVATIEPGQAVPTNIGVFNIGTAGTYPGLSGLTVSQAEIDSGFVQIRYNAVTGNWQKHVVPVAGLSGFISKSSVELDVIPASKNIFNRSALPASGIGKVINIGGSQLSDSSVNDTYDFIDISAYPTGQVFSMKNILTGRGATRSAFFTSTKAYVTGSSVADELFYKTKPANASYLRVSVRKTSAEFFQIEAVASAVDPATPWVEYDPGYSIIKSIDGKTMPQYGKRSLDLFASSPPSGSTLPTVNIGKLLSLKKGSTYIQPITGESFTPLKSGVYSFDGTVWRLAFLLPDVTSLDYKTSENLQNPDNLFPGFILNVTDATWDKNFAGYVYTADVQENTTYSIGGHVPVDASKVLVVRFENAAGVRTGTKYNLPFTGVGVFTTPAGTTRIVYSVERHDDPTYVRDFSKIMLLKGDRSTNYPTTFIPFGLIPEDNPRAKKIDGLDIESKFISGGIVTEPSTDPNSVITKKEVADKGFAIPIVDFENRVNLQDPANRADGYILNVADATWNKTFAGYVYFANVKENTTYTITGYIAPQDDMRSNVRMENSAGTRIGRYILPLSGTGAFTTPTGTTKIIYSIERHDLPERIRDYSQIMLLEGDQTINTPAFTPYVSNPKKLIKSLKVGEEVIPLLGSASTGTTPEASVTSDTLTFLNADKIIFPGCSYVESGGTSVKDKAWINKFSEYTNFQVINYGVGGNTFTMITDRIRKNNASIFTTTGIGFREYKATFASVQNIGNETLNSTGSNSDAFRNAIRTNVEAILASGYFPIFSTDWFTKNPFITEVFRSLANEYGSYMHDQGSIGEKLVPFNFTTSTGYPSDRWWGTHPDTRTNSFTASEELYQWGKLAGPKKSIKVFRKRSALQASTVNDLNYDGFVNRAKKLKEITVGNRSLTESSETNGWGYMDRSSGAASYSKSTTYTDEYLELLAGRPVTFTDYAVFDFTLDKVRNKTVDVLIKMPQTTDAKFFAKDNFNSSNYGGLTELAATYEGGYYKISLTDANLASRIKYDNLIIFVNVPGSFNISDAQLRYSGGVPKVERKTWFEEKKTYKELLPVNTFGTDWLTNGGWTTSGGVLAQMSSTHRDYPSIIGSASRHISLNYNSNDVPDTITRTIEVTPKVGHRKAVVRVVGRLFPKLYRPDLGEGVETTTVRQITPDSYDQGQLCLGIKGANISNVLRQMLYIGWTELYYEFEIPPHISTFDISLYRDTNDIIDKVNYKNHTFPAQLIYVSVQVEGE